MSDNEIFEALKHKFIWSMIFSNAIEYRDTVYRTQGIRFEIRPKEMGHNLPHCHASFQGEDVSISLIDGAILAGNIPKVKQHFASKFVVENKDILQEYWDKYRCLEL